MKEVEKETEETRENERVRKSIHDIRDKRAKEGC